MNQPTSSKGSHADPAKPVPAITPEASAVRSAVQAIRDGDRDAFARLVELYQRRLFGLSLMMVRDPSEAEEVTQDAFVLAFKHLDRFDERRPFYPWLATIAVRLAQTWLRRYVRLTTREGTELDPVHEPAATTTDPLHQLVTDERSRHLWRSVSALPSGERTAVFLLLPPGDESERHRRRSRGRKRHCEDAPVSRSPPVAPYREPEPATCSRGIDMTSKHVLTMIEALPLSEYTSHELEIAERHARDCIECRQAMADAKLLDAELGRQPEPVPPASMAAVIIARTARLDEEVPSASPDPSQLRVAEARSDRLSWAATLAGVLVGLGAEAYGLLSGASTLDLTSSRIGGVATGLIEMLNAGPSVIVFATGLLLYLAGFLGSVRGTETSLTRSR